MARRAEISGLSIRDLADYAAWLYGQQLAPASIARHLVSLKVFFRYLQLEGVLKENFAELLGSQKLWQRVPSVLSPQQIDRLFQCPHEGDPYWRRDRAMLELLYATGCRASELSNLRMRDLHLAEGYCVCRRQGGQAADGAHRRPGRCGGPRLPRARARAVGGAAAPSPADWVLLSYRGRRCGGSGSGSC